MTTNSVSHYTVRPTEPDGDIVAYRFADASAVLDYVTDVLGPEYGYDLVDIDGAEIFGYCAGDACTRPHLIGTVTVHYESADRTEHARHMAAATEFLADAVAAPSGQRYAAAYGHARMAVRAAWTSAERDRAGVLMTAVETAGAGHGYRFN